MVTVSSVSPSPYVLNRLGLCRKVRFRQSEARVWREILTDEERRQAETSESMGPSATPTLQTACPRPR